MLGNFGKIRMKNGRLKMAKRIKFRSNPENWRKEYLGLKPNTVRSFDEDIRFEILNSFIDGTWNLIDIEIENTKTTETFIRRITDITVIDTYYIISWDINDKFRL